MAINWDKVKKQAEEQEKTGRTTRGKGVYNNNAAAAPKRDAGVPAIADAPADVYGGVFDVNPDSFATEATGKAKPSAARNAVLSGLAGTGSSLSKNTSLLLGGMAQGREDAAEHITTPAWLTKGSIYANRGYDPMNPERSEQETRNLQAASALANEMARDLRDKEQMLDAQAKENLGAVGTAAYDLTKMGTQIVGDAVANRLLPGAGLLSMGQRSFGQGVMAAEDEGITGTRAIAYGAGTAAIEMATEKISAIAKPLKAIYGKGLVDDMIQNLTKTAKGNRVLSVLGSAAGEGAEEAIASVLQVPLQNITLQNGAAYDAQWLADTAYEALLGGLMGGAFGVASIPGEIAQERRNNAVQQLAEEMARESMQNATQSAPAPMQTAEQAHMPAENKMAQRAIQTAKAASVEDAASQFGEAGAQVYKAGYRDTGDDAQYFGDFYKAYQAGMRGETAPKSSLTDTETAAAHAAGVSDARRSAQATYFGKDSQLVRDDKWKRAHLSTKDSRKLDALAKVLGVKIRFVDSIDETVQNELGETEVHKSVANAQYSNGEILLALDAENPVMVSAVHEAVHRLRETTPAEYASLVQFVQNNMSSGALNWAINRRGEDYEGADRTELTEEVVADAFGQLINDTALLDQFVKDNRTVAEKLLDSIRDMINAIKRALNKQNLQLTENQKAEFQELYDNLYEAEKLLGNALNVSAENVSGKEANKIDDEKAVAARVESGRYNNNAAESVNVSVDDDTHSAYPKLSRKTWTASSYVTDREKAIQQLARDLGISEKRAANYIDDVNSVARQIADDRIRLDYESNTDETASVIKPNSEYKWSVDMSTLCAKRLLFTGTFDEIQRALPNTVFTSEDLVRLRTMMMERDLEVACGICYVESTRREMGPITQAFIDQYKESQRTGKPITRLNSEGETVELKKTKDQMKTTRDKTTDRFYADKNYTPTLADLNTTDIDFVKRDHPLVYEAYLNYMNARGQAKPKLLETRAEYKGEILRHFRSKTVVDALNRRGGLRIQSFSDFEVPHMIDMMQILLDMSRVGLKSQAYTKVPAFAAVFGNTGMKINLSLIAKGDGLDANGNLIFDDVEGINHEEAFKLRKMYSENVGTILVGKNDAHIIKAMADPRIDFIIPFHKSSWKESLYDALGLTGYEDYTDTQNEKPIDKKRKIKNFDPSEYWDFSKSGDENAQIYLEKCREDGRIPKFPQFQSYPGYWKLLIDFKMYDNEGRGAKQRAVTPDFNMREAHKILKAYEGGHRSFPVAKDVVKDFVAERKTRYSRKPGRYDYATLVAKPDMKITEIDDTVQYTADSKTRKQIVKQAQKNAATIGKTDENGGVSVYVDDIGEDVLLSGNGLKHGLDRRFSVNASVTLSAGEILKNAIRINELTPQSENASDSYVLLGAAKNKRGEPYIVEFVVNRFSKEVVSVDVLYSANAKKESAALNAPSPTENPLTVTDSKISIAQLLDIARNNFQDILPESVLRHYGYERRPDGTLGESALYSRKGTSIEKYIEKYGPIPAGEKPYREVSVPRKTGDKEKVSQTVRTVLEAEATPDEMIPTIEELVADGEFSYERYSDRGAMAGATRTIKSKGFETALADWLSEVKQGKVSKRNTALGWALYNNCANSGDTKSAMTILTAMVEHQRSAAQALQATRILKKMSPTGQLYGVQRSISNLQSELREKFGDKAPNLTISKYLADKFMDAKTQKERDEIMTEIYKDIGRQMPNSFMDKWRAWRYLAMLGNPRTHVRNIVGNAGFAPMVWTKDLVATGIEAVAGKASGGKMGRTKALPSAELISAAAADFPNAQKKILEGGKYNESEINDAIEEGRVIFKTRVLEKARVGNRKLMEQEDLWFSKGHYAIALAQYCKANSISAQHIRSGKLSDHARAYAIKEAQKATYRDTNAFSEFVSNMGRYHGNNPVGKAGSLLVEGVLPFRKTPANILVRGLEYSPAGFLKGLTWDLWMVRKHAKNPDEGITAAEAIDHISAGFVGTQLVALGAFGAMMGVLRGSGGDDEDQKKFDELQGHQAYSLELEAIDTSVTLDWLAPEVLPLFIGVNIAEEAMRSKEDLTMSDLMAAIGNVTAPMLTMSCLSGLNELFESVSYATNEGIAALPKIAMSASTSLITQAIPTLAGQIERTAQENGRMTTYTDKNNRWLTPDMQYSIGRASSRTPGWDFNQIPYIDAWGRQEVDTNRWVRGLNNFLNPAYVSKIEGGAMEEELQRLYDATGEAKVLPDRAAKYFTVNEKRKDLTAQEYVKYATAKGQKSYELVSKLTANRSWKSLSDAEKVEAISKAYEYANAVAKTKVSPYKLEGANAKIRNSGNDTLYIMAWAAQTDVDNGLKRDGETISNSKSLLQMEAMYALPAIANMDANKRKELFLSIGVGKTVAGYSKDTVKSELGKMRKTAD